MLCCTGLRVAEATSAKINEAMAAAGGYGFTGQQLLEAAVDSLSSGCTADMPSNESAQARHLRLLVRGCFAGFLLLCCKAPALCSVGLSTLQALLA